jgi:hypothetical protein
MGWGGGVRYLRYATLVVTGEVPRVGAGLYGEGGMRYLRYAALVVTGEVPRVGAGLYGRLLAGVAGARPPVRLQLLTVRAATPRRRISLNNAN